jgi:formiminotetrahydrofolate cyclodeaminase
MAGIDYTECLLNMTCAGFAHEIASESPAPSCGFISAFIASLAAVASMCDAFVNASSFDIKE